MADLLGNLLHLALGVASVTREKAEGLISDLVKRGEMSGEAGKKLMEELVARGKESREELSSTIEQKVKAVLERMELATRREVERLAERVEKLEQERDAS